MVNITGVVELLSILAGLGWLLFNLGRWVERRKERARRKGEESDIVILQINDLDESRRGARAGCDHGI